MVDHIKNRRRILSALEEELLGPSPQGTEIDCSGEIKFDKSAESYGPFRQSGSGEEILQRDRPVKRYGVGVLYPAETPADEEDESEEPTGLEQEGESESLVTEAASKSIGEISEKLSKRAGRGGDSEADDFDLSTANTYRPSTMGISFVAEFPKGSRLVVKATGGRYRARKVLVEEKEWVWWLRLPVSLDAEFAGADILKARSSRVSPTSLNHLNMDGLEIGVEVFVRPHGGGSLLTVCLVNRKEAARPIDEYCLFQTHFEARVVSPDGKPCILPYPRAPHEKLDNEEKSLSLLYRKAETFAAGHGCAAGWRAVPSGNRADAVMAECLPAFETPSITPDIERKDGAAIAVSMAALAGLVPGDDGLADLEEIVDLYEEWIEDRNEEVGNLDAHHQPTARKHLQACSACAKRMRDGLRYLRTSARARRAFQLANHAVLLQQIRSYRKARQARYDPKTARIVFASGREEPDPLSPPHGRGKWRAFQAAFMLMALRSAAEGRAPDRKTVELIWFPTGGGKTEAYLGLAAFSMFMRRLADPGDAGVSVLMRYTLRLLTAQQFQRASRLLCAMEHLRRRHAEELGREEFSIGIWLGAQTTPNTRASALESLRKLRKSRSGDAVNPFVLGRCPWCGAQIGPLQRHRGTPRNAPRVLGYEQRGDTVALKCSDSGCAFSGGLPVYVIDEDIYAKRPSLVIGTVDKFAMLAWWPEARALFGISPDGERLCSPPGLIIQDELHLISGPLGSMVGLYETAIEELCTDRRGDKPVPPKIICSTATIRRYAEQVKALYARDETALFPPPGLESGDSFFARYARKPGGALMPGRLYVGVHAPGLGSLQTAQVRTFAALIQAPVHLPPAERDPWWTLLLFFNSLRELGTTLSLLQSDIPDRFKVLRNRLGTGHSKVRRLKNIQELTGRLHGQEIQPALDALDVSCADRGGQPVDVCLASSIVEVGVDIDRLSLMSVVGQPKTTSQYIQVTGRIGRSWWERPGLVVTIYTASKPRDRSHFEKFRSYHEQLYAQVEPTSVTPFSRPALERALHAVMAIYARQTGDQSLADSPYPYREGFVAKLRTAVVARAGLVNPAEVGAVEGVFDRRAEQWRRWERLKWDGTLADEDMPLLRRAGTYVRPDHRRQSWPTQMSMRSVDAECQAEVSRLYIEGGDESA